MQSFILHPLAEGEEKKDDGLQDTLQHFLSTAEKPAGLLLVASTCHHISCHTD